MSSDSLPSSRCFKCIIYVCPPAPLWNNIISTRRVEVAPIYTENQHWYVQIYLHLFSWQHFALRYAVPCEHVSSNQLRDVQIGLGRPRNVMRLIWFWWSVRVWRVIIYSIYIYDTIGPYKWVYLALQANSCVTHHAQRRLSVLCGKKNRCSLFVFFSWPFECLT